MTSTALRKKLKTFDTLFNRVSSKALLKDSVYADSKPFEQDFAEALTLLPTLLGMSIAEAYASETWDCDDIAEATCTLIKIVNRKRGGHGAYPVFPCALKENHTIVIYVGEQIKFGEPQTGQTWTIEESKPNVIFVG